MSLFQPIQILGLLERLENWVWTGGGKGKFRGTREENCWKCRLL